MSRGACIVHGFWQKSESFDFGIKRIPSERASQKERNGTNFSFISPSIKFQLHITFHFGVKGPQKITLISVKTPYYSPWFLAKIWKF